MGSFLVPAEVVSPGKHLATSLLPTGQLGVAVGRAHVGREVSLTPELGSTAFPRTCEGPLSPVDPLHVGQQVVLGSEACLASLLRAREGAYPAVHREDV